MADDCSDELPPIPKTCEPTRAWTILAFIDARVENRADITSMPAVVEALSRQHTDQINILVQWGDANGSTYRFRIPTNTTIPATSLRSYLTTSVTNPASDGGGPTVKCFLKYASEHYPATNYGLLFLGQHGSIKAFSARVLIFALLKLLQGLAWTSQRMKFASMTKWINGIEQRFQFGLPNNIPASRATGLTEVYGDLTLPSLAKSLTELKEQNHVSPNLIVFDVCSLASVECMYELRDVADYIVASPISIPKQRMEDYQLWIGEFIKSIREKKAVPKKIAEITVNSLSQRRGSTFLSADVTGPDNHTTIGCLAESLGKLGAAMRAWQQGNDPIVDAPVVAARTKKNSTIDPSMYNLETFVSELTRDSRVPARVVAHAHEVLEKLHAIIHIRSTNPRLACYFGPTSLAVHFPQQPAGQILDEFRETQFARDKSAWLDFLQNFRRRVNSITPPSLGAACELLSDSEKPR